MSTSTTQNSDHDLPEDRSLASSPFKIHELGYSGVEERIYTATNPEVIRWSELFNQRWKQRMIFESFFARCPELCHARAVVVGTQWHRFSEMVPGLLCKAASMVSTNRKRHYVIQATFEELGMRKEEEIHADLFWQAAQLATVTATDLERLSVDNGVTQALQGLSDAVSSAPNDAQVMGLLLGLEAPAEENIETVFSALAVDEELRRSMEATLFFRFHRTIEPDFW